MNHLCISSDNCMKWGLHLWNTLCRKYTWPLASAQFLYRRKSGPARTGPAGPAAIRLRQHWEPGYSSPCILWLPNVSLLGLFHYFCFITLAAVASMGVKFAAFLSFLMLNRVATQSYVQWAIPSYAIACIQCDISNFNQVPYSRKYWRSLNLAVWSRAAEIKVLADLNLAVVPYI